MSDQERRFAPVVKSLPSLKVQVPHTPEGREFIERLKRLLNVDDLPFTPSCTSQHGRPPVPQASNVAATALSSQGSTTYGLDLRLEQEGWPP